MPTRTTLRPLQAASKVADGRKEWKREFYATRPGTNRKLKMGEFASRLPSILAQPPFVWRLLLEPSHKEANFAGQCIERLVFFRHWMQGIL